MTCEVVSEAVRLEALNDASPLMCAALQDMRDGMAGEGKLLNLYHLLRRALDRTASVEDLDRVGHVVELGCNRGITACLLQAILVKDAKDKAELAADKDDDKADKSLHSRRARRELHLFDSFEGLPVGSKEHDPACYASGGGSMACSPDDVLANFAACKLPPPTQVHQGWFADTCPGGLPTRIAFAHLDGDLYDSIKDSLELVYPRLVKGAIVVVDDYCDPAKLNRHDLFPGAFAACQEFFEDKPEKLQILPAPHPGYLDRNGFAFPAQYETHAFFEKI